jgi:hypothetical protein
MTSYEFNSLNFFMGHRTKPTQQIHLCTPAAEDTEEMRIRPFHSVWNLRYSSRSWIVSMTTRSSTAVRKSRSGSQEIAQKPPWSRVCAWATKCPICVWWSMWVTNSGYLTATIALYVGEEWYSRAIRQNQIPSVRSRETSSRHVVKLGNLRMVYTIQ